MKATPLYNRVREILESSRLASARSVNTAQVVANWLIGRELVEEEQKGRRRADYGKKIIEDLALHLQGEFGKGYSALNLWLFRRFYIEYPRLVPEPIPYAPRKELRGCGAPVTTGKILYSPRKESSAWKLGNLHPNLSWTHYRLLLRVDRVEIRAFYEIEALKNNWSSRELERQINSLLYERLAKSRDKTGLINLATKGQEIQKPGDVFKDPIVIEFLGKMQLYVNYYDHERRTQGDSPTLGLILCTDKNDAVVKYTLGPDQEKKIFASRYKLYLPTEEELRVEIRRELKLLNELSHKICRGQVMKERHHQNQ